MRRVLDEDGARGWINGTALTGTGCVALPKRVGGWRKPYLFLACRSAWMRDKTPRDTGALQYREMTERDTLWDAAGAFYQRERKSSQSGVWWRHSGATKQLLMLNSLRCCGRHWNSRRCGGGRRIRACTNRSCRSLFGSIQRLVCLRRRAGLSYGLRMRKLDHKSASKCCRVAAAFKCCDATWAITLNVQKKSMLHRAEVFLKWTENLPL